MANNGRRSTIPAADLGEAGETLFANLCARGGLDCNGSDRDRTGWDFTVEFSGRTEPLDQRRKTVCHVQVKATTTTGDVPLSLSSASLLAMSTLPAFVVMFRMGPGGEALRGYLIHMLDVPLARVLRRLRQAQAQGRTDVNKLKITFDHRRYGVLFEPTPAALRAAIATASGSDPIAYAHEKSRQLEMLGYEDGGIFANAVFKTESEDHFNRVLLGMAPLRPERLDAVDVRFGIPVPYSGDMFEAVEEIMLHPPSAGTCQVTITGAPMTPPAVFHAELLFAPPFDQNLRMLVRHPDFTILFRETDAAFESTATFTPDGRSLDGMVTILRALSHMATGKSEIIISDVAGRFGPLRLPVEQTLTGPYVEALPDLARIAADWQTILGLAGIVSTARLTVDDFWDSNWAGVAADLLLHRGGKVRLAFEASAVGADGSPVKAVMVNGATVAGESVSYAVEVELVPKDGQSATYVSRFFRPLEVRSAVPDVDVYLQEIADRFDCKVMIHPNRLVEVRPDRFDSPWNGDESDAALEDVNGRDP